MSCDLDTLAGCLIELKHIISRFVIVAITAPKSIVELNELELLDDAHKKLLVLFQIV